MERSSMLTPSATNNLSLKILSQEPLRWAIFILFLKKSVSDIAFKLLF